MYPKDFFSHPRISAFCHRTGIWRQASDLYALGKKLRSLLDITEIKRWENECSSYHLSNPPSMVDIYSPEYPALLKEIYDPPLIIGYHGNLSVLQGHMVGIVGTRKASAISLLATGLLVSRLKEFSIQLTVVSGMALGVDRQAFISAMDEGLPVVGILGTCIHEEYPPGNRDLYRKVKANPSGLLLTEFIYPTEPARWTFPKRNRLISGLSTDIYIMESGKKSGTLSTAMSAISQNREVHVFDHELQSDNTGGKLLLYDGALSISWEQLANNKGYLDKPIFYESDHVYGQKDWKVRSEKERTYLRTGKKILLGKGFYWVVNH